MTTRRLMESLGLAGLLPFYGFALSVWLTSGPLQVISAQGFVIYGVVILAFLGGTLWGYAVQLQGVAKQVRLVLSNAVALVAAGAGLLGSMLWAAVALAIAQLLLLAFERASGDRRSWYLRLRTRLTIGVMPAYLLFLAGWSTPLT